VQGNTLAVVRTANSLAHELLGNVRDHFAAVSVANQFQHHIHRGLSAGTGNAIAVDQEQIVGDPYRGKLFTQTGDVFPVNRTFVTIQ